MPPDTPTPGSDEAVEQGCLCPVLTNGHGLGVYGGWATDEHGNSQFWVVADCPLHGVKREEPSDGGGDSNRQ